MVVVNRGGYSDKMLIGASFGTTEEKDNFRNVDEANGSLSDFLPNIPQT
jgi:hypothetical protein